MLGTKLKSWVESHLTRKSSGGGGGKTTAKKSAGHHKLTAQLHHQDAHPSSGTLTADRIAHPSSSLVGLIPAVPLAGAGRSNAALVIRLQNDLSSSLAAASSSSPSLRKGHYHPATAAAWSQSPVMAAWGRRATPCSSSPAMNNQRLLHQVSRTASGRLVNPISRGYQQQRTKVARKRDAQLLGIEPQTVGRSFSFGTAPRWSPDSIGSVRQ